MGQPGRPEKHETRAAILKALKEGRRTAEVPDLLGLSQTTLEWQRRRIVETGLALPLGHGLYDLTGKGERYLSRWGTRISSGSPPPISSGGTGDGPNLWEIHNTRWNPPILRLTKPPEPTRHLGATPIHTRRLYPPHPQDPREEVAATLELWGQPPNRAKFYLRTFPLLASYRHVLILQEDMARSTIQEATRTVGIGLPRSPEGYWQIDKLGKAARDPLPSGHARLMLPELQGVIMELVTVSATAIMDNSPGAGWETGDIQEGHQADLLYQALRSGRVPDEILALKESQAQLRNALLMVSDRLTRGGL